MKNKTYTPEERREILDKIESLHKAGKKLNEAAQKVGVHPSLYYQWRKGTRGVKNRNFRAEGEKRRLVEQAITYVQGGRDFNTACKQIGISDGLVRSWCRNLGYPSKIEDIRAYQVKKPKKRVSSPMVEIPVMDLPASTSKMLAVFGTPQEIIEFARMLS